MNQEKQRRRKLFYSWTGALLLAGILLAVNFIVSFLPLRLDTSEGRIYSISSGTKSILSEIDDTLLIQVIFTSDLPPVYKLNENYVRDILAEYKRASGGHIRVEYVDPGKNREARQDAIQKGVIPLQIDVRERDRREVKEVFMGLAIFYGDKKEAIPFVQDTRGLEYEISQRIKKLINPDVIKIGMITTGGGETVTDPSLEPIKAQLEQLFQVVNVDLDEQIPLELKALWLVGPKEELSEAHLASLEDWVNRGGTLGLLINTQSIDYGQFSATPQKTGFDALFNKWGVRLSPGLIFDPQADRIQVQTIQGAFRMINLIDYPYFPLVTDLNRDHPATKDLDGISVPFSSPIIIDAEKEGFTYTTLARSSPKSWVNKNPGNLSPMVRQGQPADADTGPFNLGLLIEKQGPNPGRVILFGSSRWISSDLPARATNFNLLLNLMDWSVQDEALLSIRSKGAARRTLKQVSDGVRNTVKYAMMLFLPLLSIGLGLFVWRRQKLRRSMMPLHYRDA